MGNLCGADVEEHYPWPTCEMHYKLATSFTDFYSWVWNCQNDPHDSVHIWIGGTIDCEEDYAKIGELLGEETMRSLITLSFIYRKALYRNGLFSCTGSADVSQKPEEVKSG